MKITMVRIYCTEGEGKFKELMNYLHDEAKVAGVTAFRGIIGFGRSGKIHTASLLDLSLDLPIVIEFFDQPDKIRPIIEYLQTKLEPGHLVHWTAEVNHAGY